MEMELTQLEYFSGFEQNAIDELLLEYINETVTFTDFTEKYYDEDGANAINAGGSTLGRSRFCVPKDRTLRLIQSMINLLDGEEPLNIEKYRSLLSIRNRRESFDMEQLLALIDPFVHPQLDSFARQWTKHRNICFVLVIVLRYMQLHRDDRSPRLDTFSVIAQYLVTVLGGQSANLETVLYAVIALGNICSFFLDRRQQLLADCWETLRQLLGQLTIKANDPCPLSAMYSGLLPCLQYQTGFQAYWCLDLLAKEKGVRPSAAMKLSPNRLSARNDQLFNYPSVYSPVIVSSGVLFYEVILLTSGEMRLGWISSNGSTSGQCLGADLYSIGLDGYRRCLWQCGVYQSLPVMDRWKVGDVIGLLIDFPNETFRFYHNGKCLDLSSSKVHFSSLPYCPAASLSVHQQCYFNFGQAPFKYLPTLTETSPDSPPTIDNLHSLTNGETHKYRLQEIDTSKLRVAMENSSETFRGFLDTTQRQFDQMVILIERHIASDGVLRRTSATSELKKTLLQLLHLPTSWHRLFQSLIEHLGSGSELKQNRMDILLQWLISCFDHLISEPTDADSETRTGGRGVKASPCRRNVYSRCASFQMDRIKSEHPLGRLLDKYLVGELSDLQVRNLFLVLSFLTQSNFFVVPLATTCNQILHYAVKVLTEGVFQCTLSPSAQLFILLTMDNLTTGTNKLSEMKQRTVLMQTLQMLADNEQQYRLQEQQIVAFRKYLERQVSFVAAHYLRQLRTLDESESDASSTVDNALRATFNPSDCTANVKLSDGCLSVRNDHYDGPYWQTIRSLCSASSGLYYYEVTLFTSGPMRIGWATGRSELAQLRAIGEDEFSVGFDGYHSTLTNDAVEYSVAGMKRRWEPGDVVGCLIDFTKGIFTFSLNGERMSTRWRLFHSVFFSAQPYYAAVSLYVHQQVTVNFGQRPFAYAPKRVDFLDFHHHLVSRKHPVRVSHSIIAGNLCTLCNVESATLKFAKCNHWELCAKCAPKLIQCPNCDLNTD